MKRRKRKFQNRFPPLMKNSRSVGAMSDSAKRYLQTPNASKKNIIRHRNYRYKQ